MRNISSTKRQYTGAEIAEAIMVYDELKRIGAVDKGRLDAQKIASDYRNEGWGKNVDFDVSPLRATVEELPPQELTSTVRS